MTAPAAPVSTYPSVLLVGCGRMGQALLGGWLGCGFPPRRIHVIEPAPDARAPLPVPVVADVAALGDGFTADVVVLAVKPQVMGSVLPACAPLVARNPRTVFLSIAAGRTLGFFERHLGPGAAIVRSMPNTPAAVGRGVTVACSNRLVTVDQRAVCERLLVAIGRVLWVDDETLLDGVTAVSGSGPAYVFLLVEALASAGEAAGLPAPLAATLARDTLTGAAALLAADDTPPAALRRAVTSPGGTTEAALAVLMADGGLKDVMAAAVRAAAGRSRALAE